MEENLLESWRNFKGNNWQNEINVADFIANNYSEYTGDDAFLASPTTKTKAMSPPVVQVEITGSAISAFPKIVSIPRAKIPVFRTGQRIAAARAPTASKRQIF